MSKVILGMSGGIDSSVTAYLLKERGYDVEGVSFILFGDKERGNLNVCSCLSSITAASKNAAHLGISHTIIDVQKKFREKVISPFINLYLKGLTPNPCILCNRFIKFPMLFKIASEKGADYIATGHYVRIESADSIEKAEGINNLKHLNHYLLLKKGIDEKKDQSYVLYTLGQEELKRLITPLGYYRKNDVKRIATEIQLPVIRSESKEICFIEHNKYSKFIERVSNFTNKPGSVIHIKNNVVLGKHKGIYRYTIGQRKGLGIAFREPLYVVRIDAEKNILYVGPHEFAKKKEFLVENLNWIIPPSEEILKVSVKIRSTMKNEPATIFLMDSNHQAINEQNNNHSMSIKKCGLVKLVRVVFDEPQWAPAPGQSAVFYKGDIVIGGGVIKESI